MDNSRINDLIESQRDYVIDIRRDLHRHPELSGKEERTRGVIVREIEAMGFSYELLPGTGVIAAIEGGRPGGIKALRADIDALPVQEEFCNLKQQKACVSEVGGVCHACGHDAHTAMLLGTMRVLKELQPEIEGTVLCCFEEGEETNCGIDTMLAALEKYNIDEIFALHVYADFDAGKINISPGPRMSGAHGIDIHIHGKAGHGSRPDKAINPIVPAAHTVTQLYSAFQNRLDAEETVTLGICVLQAGEVSNIIPDEAQIRGTVRYFDKEQGRLASELLRSISENTAKSHGCTASFPPFNRVLLEPVINDAGVASKVTTAVRELCGDRVIGDCDKWFASECYSKYLDRYPGSLGLLGIRNAELGSGAPHHNGQFDLDESALTLGVAAEVAFILAD